MKNKTKKAKELIELALLDSAFFPKGRKYPCFDLCLYSYNDCFPSQTDSEDIGGFFGDAWIDCLTRPLNFSVLMPGEGLGWDTAFGQGIKQVSRNQIRGIAERRRCWEHAQLKTKRSDSDRQKYAQPHTRSIPVFGDIFKYSCYGDGAHMNQRGVYSHYLIHNKGMFVAVAESGIVLDTRRLESEGSMNKTLNEHLKSEISIACGMQFSSEYLWRVVLQFEDGRPNISFSASKSIVTELLKMRTESDKEKKCRMIHIVSSHARKNKEGAADNVMRHYRGGVETLWQGCAMQIIPPVNETDSMEKFTTKIEEVKAYTQKIQPLAIA